MQTRDSAAYQELVRRAIDPAAGGPGATSVECRDCSGAFWRWKGDRRQYCPSCGAERQRRQQAAARAKARAQWLESYRVDLDAAAAAKAARLGIEPRHLPG